MPKKFDDMVKAIQDTGKSEQDAYAIATTQWKKSHGGKAPQRESIENKISRYLEDEGQPELFGLDSMLHGIKLPENDEEYLHHRGREVASKIVQWMMAEATQIIVSKTKEMNYEGGAEFQDHYDDMDDYAEDSEAYYDLIADMCRAFLEGMEEEWPHPIMG